MRRLFIQILAPEIQTILYLKRDKMFFKSVLVICLIFHFAASDEHAGYF